MLRVDWYKYELFTHFVGQCYYLFFNYIKTGAKRDKLAEEQYFMNENPITKT